MTGKESKGKHAEVVLELLSVAGVEARFIGSIQRRGFSDHDIDLLIERPQDTTQLRQQIVELLHPKQVITTDWNGIYCKGTPYGDVDVFFQEPATPADLEGLLLNGHEQIQVLKQFCKERHTTAVECDQAFLMANLRAQLAKLSHALPLYKKQVEQETRREVGKRLHKEFKKRYMPIPGWIYSITSLLECGEKPETKEG